jgi:hypothetical protein
VHRGATTPSSSATRPFVQRESRPSVRRFGALLHYARHDPDQLIGLDGFADVHLEAGGEGPQAILLPRPLAIMRT